MFTAKRDVHPTVSEQNKVHTSCSHRGKRIAGAHLGGLLLVEHFPQQLLVLNHVVLRSGGGGLTPTGLQPVRLAGGCCWFVLKEEYCWLVAGGWFILREEYCWLVTDKPSEQAVSFFSPSWCRSWPCASALPFKELHLGLGKAKLQHGVELLI
jgi:hypothetical protein